MDESEGEGLWFNELIEFNVIGGWNSNRPIEEHESILSFYLYGAMNKGISKSPLHFIQNIKAF